MTTLFKNGLIIDVINQKTTKNNLVVKDNKIIYIGNNYKNKVDKIVDIKGK